MATDLIETATPWIGPVPAHWDVSRFGYEATINGGQVDPQDEPWRSMVLVAPNHIESGTGRIIGRETALEQGADSGKYLAARGQLLYSKIRPLLNKVAIAKEDCLCSADMYAVSFRPPTDIFFAQYQMLAKPFHTFSTLMSQRVKMPKINREELAEAPWLLPPAAEQRAIADFLDRETAQIDTLIARQEQLVETLRDRQASLTASELYPRGSKSVAPRTVGAHFAVKPALERVPTHWTVKRFKALMTRREERNLNLMQPMMSLKSTGHIVLRSSLGGRQEPDDSSLPRYLIVYKDDLVVNPMWLIGGAIGISQVVGAVSPDYRVFSMAEEVYPRFLHHLLRSRAYVDQYKLYTRATTTFDRRVQQGDLDNLPILLPPRDEQVAIAQRIDLGLERTGRLTAKAQEFIALSKERRAALITAAVTGQIDLRKSA